MEIEKVEEEPCRNHALRFHAPSITVKKENREGPTFGLHLHNNSITYTSLINIYITVVKKNTIPRLFYFLNLYVEKMALVKAVTFNTTSTIKKLSLNSQNRLFPCSEIGPLIGFLVFHPIKINFVKPEAYAIIFSTASPVFEFMKKRNKKIKKGVNVAAQAPPFFVSLTET